MTISLYTGIRYRGKKIYARTLCNVGQIKLTRIVCALERTLLKQSDLIKKVQRKEGRGKDSQDRSGRPEFHLGLLQSCTQSKLEGEDDDGVTVYVQEWS